MRMLKVKILIMMMKMKIISHAFLWDSVLSVQSGCLLYVAERIRRVLSAPTVSGASLHLHVSDEQHLGSTDTLECMSSSRGRSHKMKSTNTLRWQTDASNVAAQ